MRGDATQELNRVDPETLTPEQRAEARLKHDQLFLYLLDLPGTEEGLLLSRQSPAHMYQTTGLFIEDGVVNAKVGEHPHQPIGWDDGTHFFPLLGSSILWLREFARATVTPYRPAFKVERLKSQAESTDQAMSDHEREVCQGIVADFREALKEHEGAELEYAIRPDPVKFPFHPDEALLDTLKLARIQSKRLDTYFAAYEEAWANTNPEGDLVTAAMSNHTIKHVIRGMAEWLDMKLADDQVRRDAEETVQKVEPTGTTGPTTHGAPDLDLQERLHQELRAKILATLQGSAQSPDRVFRAIIQAKLALPEVSSYVNQAIESGTSQEEARQHLIGMLIGEDDKGTESATAPSP